jgi:hypothetical protein
VHFDFMLPEDVITKVRQDFGESDGLVILQLLQEIHERNLGGWYGDRVMRCIVFVAAGSFDRFVSAVYEDPRDLIQTAEYDGWHGEDHHIMNFELPFTKNAT